MDAYLDGLERARQAGRDLSRIESVASFFVSRVDAEIDARLDKIGTPEAQALRGTAAIANARLAYERYERVFSSDRWEWLEADNAWPQRPLWASTGVKDPTYDDTRYVVELVAPGVVNHHARADAARRRRPWRRPRQYDQGSYTDARRVLDGLAAVGVDYDDVVRALEEDGVTRFQASLTELLHTVAAAMAQHRG